MISPTYIQILAAVLFCLGIATVISKRNIFFAFLGLELAINAANLSFIGFSKTLPAFQRGGANRADFCDSGCRCRGLRGFGYSGFDFPQPRNNRF